MFKLSVHYSKVQRIEQVQPENSLRSKFGCTWTCLEDGTEYMFRLSCMPHPFCQRCLLLFYGHLQLTQEEFFTCSCEYPCVGSVSFGICCGAAVSCKVRVLKIFRGQIARLISLAAVSVHSSCVCCTDNMICKELLPVES